MANSKCLTGVVAIITIVALMLSSASFAAAKDKHDKGKGRSEEKAKSDSDDIAADGAFTCDFGLATNLSFADVPAILEKDRVNQSARPGFLRKLVPLFRDFSTGALFSGGRYLFDTYDNAKAYKYWVQNNYVLDGVKFFDRPYFLSPECHAWKVIGAHDFADIHTSQVVVRTERWAVPKKDTGKVLKTQWPTIKTAAASQGLTSVWLLYNKKEDLASLIYFANRVTSADPSVPDFVATLGALAFAPPLGQPLTSIGWSKVFDRTHWVLTIWFPSSTGAPSLWPNSPPFPKP